MEKFSQVLSAVPTVSHIEITLTDGRSSHNDFFATVHFKDNQLPQRFGVEVRSNGELRYVNRFVQDALLYQDNVCYVFMAPYISEQSADMIRSKNFGYMDLSGNCYLASSGIFIQISGQPNLYKEHRQNKDYFSKNASAASAVMRTMLSQPDSCWQVKLLAQHSRKSLGTVSNVKSFLREHDWIKEQEAGFTLHNIRQMLYAWAQNYHLKPARVQEYYSLDSIAEIEAGIAGCNKTHNTNAILGGFSAAVRYAPTVRYKKVQVYVTQQELETVVRQLDLQPVESGGNVVVTIPHDETPCMFARTINGNLVTSPVQTVIDLLGSSSRGEEAADAIIRKEFEQEK